MDAITAPATTTIDSNDPRLTEPQVAAWGGLTFDAETGRWTIRPDLDKPLEPDQETVAKELLRLDNPTDDKNTYRSQANSLVACNRLGRLAECEHGDEARFYYVHCGQNRICQLCGSGRSQMRQLRHERPDQYALIDTSPHQVLTFSLELGSPSLGLWPQELGTESRARELALRQRFAKYLYRRLRAALDRQADVPYGAKYYPIVNPDSTKMEFRVLFVGLTRTLHKIRSMWEAVCVRHWDRIMRMILGERGIHHGGSGEWVEAMIHQAVHAVGLACVPVSHVAKQSYDVGSADKSLTLLLSGLEPLLMLPPAARVVYATALHLSLSITTGLLRGQALEEAAEGLWIDYEDETPHGECTNHHTPLQIVSHDAITPREASIRFERVWFGPMGGDRVKAVHSIPSSPPVILTTTAFGPSPPPS